MKNLFVKLLLSLLCLIRFNVNAQQEVYDPVAEYFSKIKPHLYAAAENTKTDSADKDILQHDQDIINNLGFHISGMNLEDILNYTRLRIKAMESDSIQYTRVLNKDNYIYKQKINKRELIERPVYAHFEIASEIKLREHYSDEIVNLINVPLVLHVRIASLRDSASYEEIVANRKFKKEKVTVTADILDALKGEGIKKYGNSLHFYYMKHWMNNSKSFEAGKEYLVFLSILFDSREDEKYQISLVAFPKNDGVFPIEGGMINNDSGYYEELSGCYPYEEFKALLKEKIIGRIR